MGYLKEKQTKTSAVSRDLLTEVKRTDKMYMKIGFLCFILAILHTEAFVKRDVAQQPNILESFQRNMDEFRKCLDQTFAKSADEVNTKQLQPLFNVIGDQVNRVSKAFDDLTAPRSTKTPLEN